MQTEFSCLYVFANTVAFAWNFVFSLTSPSLSTGMVHLSPAQCQLHYEIDALKLNRNSQTPKPLMTATFFSPPFLSVLAREMEPLGYISCISVCIWMDAYILCACA